MQHSQVERGIRYKEMGATFDAQLADAKRQKSEASDREAKRLAFYIFWNVKRDFDRCAKQFWAAHPRMGCARMGCIGKEVTWLPGPRLALRC